MSRDSHYCFGLILFQVFIWQAGHNVNLYNITIAYLYNNN